MLRCVEMVKLEEIPGILQRKYGDKLQLAAVKRLCDNFERRSQAKVPADLVNQEIEISIQRVRARKF